MKIIVMIFVEFYTPYLFIFQSQFMFYNKSQDCVHTFITRIHHLGFGPSDIDLVSSSIGQSLILGPGDLVLIKSYWVWTGSC